MTCKNRNPSKKWLLAFSGFIVCSFSLENFHRLVKEVEPAVSLSFILSPGRVAGGECGWLACVPQTALLSRPVWH